MSLEAMNWVFTLDGPRLADRLVMLVLADYADQAGRSWPSVRRVAERAGLSMDAARAALRRVERAGYVAIELRPVLGAKNKSNVYVLAMTGGDEYALDAPPATDDQPPAPSSSALPPVEQEALPPVEQEALPPVEQEGNRTIIRTTKGTTREEPSNARASSFEEFWQTYPRRQAKPAAEQAWKRATRKAPPQQIIAAAAAYRDDPNREDGFTAHAATWLNQERWNDPPLPARGGQKQSAVASNMREYERLFGRRALGA